MKRYFLLSCLFLAPSLHADALSDLLAILEPVQGMAAGFTEDTFNAQGAIQQHNEGELKAQAPNRFYWKTAEPYPQEIVTDGKTLWVYDPDLQQVTIKPFEENYAKTPAMLFAGNARSIAEHFTVEKINGSPQAFRLLPKDNQKDLFESLEMTFEKNTPASMTIRDAMQQKTTIFFSGVKINGDIPAASFHFDVPKGVEILKAK
ncbi:MAG TPA: outer membrane lipoprotein chaperone LolA [Pseudomonadales bacterium]|nr:outer membrane lipoprotein chaperone LolA [Pseudomonadales bacterium]